MAALDAPTFSWLAECLGWGQSRPRGRAALKGLLPLMLGFLLPATPVGLMAQVRTAREVESHSVGTPNWKIEEGFQKDVFTFVRIKYSVNGKYGFGHTRER